MTRIGGFTTMALALLLAACGGGGGGGGGGDDGDTDGGGGTGPGGGTTPMAVEVAQNASLRVTLAIVDPPNQDTTSRPVPWDAGENMPVILSIENISTSPVTFSINRDPWHDVTVLDAATTGTVVWQMVPSGTPVSDQVTLQPGAKLEWTGTWTSPPIGDYTMTAAFQSSDPVLPITPPLQMGVSVQ